LYAQYESENAVLKLSIGEVVMPTYVYRCKACDYEFEEVQKITEDSLEKCPRCRELELKRVMQPSGFQLKGSGWYNKGKM